MGDRHDNFRILASQNLTVQSTGGAAVSTAKLGVQTYAIQLCAVGSFSSTGGVRYEIGDTPAATGSSALLPPGWVSVYKCTPGQKVSALSNDVGAPSLNIVELGD